MAPFLARALGLTPITPPPPSGGRESTAMFVAVRQGDTAVIDANRFRTAEILAAIDQVGSRNLKWMVDRFYDRGSSRTVKDSNT